MNYEKELEGRIEAARQVYSASDTSLAVKKALTGVFPELLESEDEKIRKDLLVEVQSWEGIPNSKRKEYVAWLENQKPIKYDFLKDFGFAENGYDPMNVLMTIKRKWPMIWEKMLYQEQKPIEWSEEDKLGLQNTIALIQGYKDCNDKDEYCVEGCDYSLNWLNSLKERHLWRPSEEQIRVFEYFVKYVCECSLVLKENKNKLTSLLEQLKKL